MTMNDDEVTEGPDIWALLEEPAPEGCEAVQDLYSWSLNYEGGKGPFGLFLDLTEWSDENLGEDLYNYRERNLGFVELGKLADALNEYANRPGVVADYTDRLIEAEMR